MMQNFLTFETQLIEGFLEVSDADFNSADRVLTNDAIKVKFHDWGSGFVIFFDEDNVFSLVKFYWYDDTQECLSEQHKDGFTFMSHSGLVSFSTYASSSSDVTITIPKTKYHVTCTVQTNDENETPYDRIITVVFRPTNK